MFVENLLFGRFCCKYIFSIFVVIYIVLLNFYSNGRILEIIVFGLLKELENWIVDILSV